MKMPKPAAKAIAQADPEKGMGGSFEALPEGYYNAIVEDIDPTCEGPAGPYWKFTFRITDEEYEGRRQWRNVSFSPNAANMAAAFFKSLGVWDSDPKVFWENTDHEDLIGKKATLHLIQKIQQEGKNKGKMGNEIATVYPLGGGPGIETPDLPAAAGTSAVEEEDPF